MHSYMTGFKIDVTALGYILTIYSPMGTYSFDVGKRLMGYLVDEAIEKIYDLPLIEDHQLELFEEENDGI